MNPCLFWSAVGDTGSLFRLFELFNCGVETFVGLPEVNYLLSQLSDLSVFISGLFFEFLTFLFGGYCLFHTSLHLLNELSQLSVFFIFLAHLLWNIGVLVLHLADDDVALLEFLLDDFELLWVSEGILAFNNLFKLMPKAGTFVNVHFVFYLKLLQLRASDVAL